ncbi:hypothetical protein KAU11_11540 [Candidatus Babeliales bacterium]|nr:hypothetical protein [Candidatus Babeliales bacterium]
MAIDTDDAIDKFGTQDAVTTTGASTADDAFTSAGSWTNDDDAPSASAVGTFTFATAATAGTVVNLYARLMNIQSTNDQEVPDANYQNTYMGSFPVNDGSTSPQYIAIDIYLPNTMTSQVYDFYIENKAGQTISANWSLHITPKSIGPHA